MQQYKNFAKKKKRPQIVGGSTEGGEKAKVQAKNSRDFQVGKQNINENMVRKEKGKKDLLRQLQKQQL